MLRPLNQLTKLPNNPRTITKEDFKRLCNSIENNPQHLSGRPLILSNRTGELIIIAGNQRYEACRHLGYEEVPTYLIENLTEEQEKEIAIRDNVNNGDWDYELLANEYDTDLLIDWGVELPVDFSSLVEENIKCKQDEDEIPEIHKDLSIDRKSVV